MPARRKTARVGRKHAVTVITVPLIEAACHHRSFCRLFATPSSLARNRSRSLQRLYDDEGPGSRPQSWCVVAHPKKHGLTDFASSAGVASLLSLTCAIPRPATQRARFVSDRVRCLSEKFDARSSERRARAPPPPRFCDAAAPNTRNHARFYGIFTCVDGAQHIYRHRVAQAAAYEKEHGSAPPAAPQKKPEKYFS